MSIIRSLSKIAFTAASVVFISSQALATPFSSTVNCADTSFSSNACHLYEGSSYEYQHNLGLDIPGSDTVTDASFSITFRDDGNASDYQGWGFFTYLDYREDATVTFEGVNPWDINGGGNDLIAWGDTSNNTFGFTGDISSWLNDDGILDVALSVDNLIDSYKTWGIEWCGSGCVADIKFVSSTVEGNYRSQSVPEPGSLALLGLGLAGLGMSRRRAK